MAHSLLGDAERPGGLDDVRGCAGVFGLITESICQPEQHARLIEFLGKHVIACTKNNQTSSKVARCLTEFMDTSHTKIIFLQKSPLAEEMAEDGTSDLHGAGEDGDPQPSTSPAEDKAQHSTVASDEGIIPRTVGEPAEVPTFEEQAITTSDLSISAQETNKVGMWTKLKRAISRRRGSSKSLLGVDKMSSGPDDSAVPATEESGGRRRPWLNPHGLPQILRAIWAYLQQDWYRLF